MRGSPCRRHPCSWHHANLVESYRSAAEAQRVRAEAATAGHATELAEFYATEPRLTFRRWLEHSRESR